MQDGSPEQIILNTQPLVAGVPLKSLEGDQTPAELFFVRNHYSIPQIDSSSWRLEVSGAVESPFTLTYDELLKMPSREVDVLLECAGNSRASVQPSIEGLLWDHSGVSSGSWKGVSVSQILKRSGIKGDGQEVLFQGADQGEERGDVGKSSYAMSIPLEKAMDPDTILAYRLNGEDLSPSHGYPIRALVPGWYGMTSVKWVTAVKVVATPHDGYHQSKYYVFQKPGDEDGAPKSRVSTMGVKSLITWPGRGDYLEKGSHLIRGVAWSGKGPVLGVEVSTDDGKTWQGADVKPSRSAYSWQSWQFEWKPKSSGYFLIRARATDTAGRIQPAQFDWNFRGFANNSIHVVPVTVM